jgi:hypothetical protein
MCCNISIFVSASIIVLFGVNIALGYLAMLVSKGKKEHKFFNGKENLGFVVKEKP